MAQKKNKAKFEYQQKIVDTIDKKFLESLKLRNALIKKSIYENRAEITSLDLLMSELIKKRARLTLGGYNYIHHEMWEWNPYFPMHKNLLPKILK
tara:strand:- start:1628 stop:1912 length:285 start_codon:yes stop_codon:yes gene_type:complete